MKKIFLLVLTLFTSFSSFQLYSKSIEAKAVKDDYSKSIKNGGTIRNKKIFVQKDFEDFNSLISSIKLTPHIINEKLVGVKIIDIMNNSIWHNIGMKKGDILLAINDQKIDIFKNNLSPLTDSSVKKILFKIIRNEKLINLEIRKL